MRSSSSFKSRQGSLLIRLLPFLVGTLLLTHTRPVDSFAPILTSIKKSSASTPAPATPKKNRHVLQTSSSSSSSKGTPREVNTNKQTPGGLTKIVKTVLPFAAGVILLKKTLSLSSSISPMDILTITTITNTKDALLTAINSFFLSFPYVAAFTVCGFKAALADFVAQRSAMSSFSKNEKKNENNASGSVQPTFEYRRNLAFLFYGGAYQGCVQEFIFNHIFPFLFGSSTDILTVFIKVTTDMLILSPFLCLPVAYIIKGFIYKQSIKTSIRRYIFDVKENMLLKKYWMVWAPVQFLTFGVIPEHFRIGWIAFVSFFWLIILSSISGKKTTT